MILLPLAILASQTAGQIADPVEFSRPLVKLLEAQWLTNRTVTIVCHGHSVPAGYAQTPIVRTLDAYPQLLLEAIKKKYPYAVVNVIVTAIGGEASEAGAARFDRDVMSLRPDVVTIDYALNDRGIGLERARAAWVKMIQSAKKGGAHVILLTPSWDLSAHPDDPNDPLRQHARRIRELAKKYGIGLADSLNAFLEAKTAGIDMATLMAQSNHPNRAGHELILRGLLPW